MNINELKFHGCTAWFDDHGNIVYGIFEKRKESSKGLTADMIIGSPIGLKMVKALRDSSSGEQRKKCEQFLQDVADLSRKRQREAKFTKYVRNPYESASSQLAEAFERLRTRSAFTSLMFTRL